MSTIGKDAAIVGGGMIGCWTAYFLANRGLSVALLEKGVIGAQSSGVNFGNLRLQGRYEPQLPLALRAHELWERCEALIGDSCEFRATGHLRVALDERELATVHRHAEAALAHGLEIELMDKASLQRRCPWLSRSALGAGFSPRDAVANPRIAGPAVARAARALGVDVLEKAKVVGINMDPGRFRVHTDGDLAIECTHLVNAAGAWGGEIAGWFAERVPLIIGGPPQFVTAPVPYLIEPYVQLVDGSLILRQTLRGNVLATGYPRGAADAANNRAPVAPAKTLKTMARLAEIVPALAPAHVIRVWSGIEGYLPDMLPIIGPSRTAPGLFHAFGFCGHGFQLAPGVGIALSELICEGRTAVPLDIHSMARFEAQEIVMDARHDYDFDDSMLAAGSGRQEAGRA